MASIFLDLKKAFDTVNHDILLKQFEYYGFRGKSMTLLKSYLSNRGQITKLGENRSSKLNINIGVPQGSILGPILFILYINDIHKCLDISDDRNLILFADDTSLSIRKNNNIDLTNQLISDVNSLYEWLNLNKLKLNTAKTKIHIYKGASLTSNILIERQQLSICKTYNFLGIILDTKLDFKQHIISIQIKLSKIIYMLKKLSTILPKKILYLLYNSLFLPHVLYCLELWGNVYFSNIYEIELLQKK